MDKNNQNFKQLKIADIDNLNTFIDVSDAYKKNIISKPLNKRAKLDTGKLCNEQCNFCYYHDMLDSRDYLHPENAGYLVGFLLDKGIEEIEMSGGEPSTHPKIFEVIEAIKKEFQKRNLEPKISMVSNGNMPEAKFLKLLDAGVNEFLISLQGNANTHDEIVNRKGAFNRISSIIKLYLSKENPNFKSLRINSVIHPIKKKSRIPNLNDWNDSTLDSAFKNILLYILKNGIQVNLLPLNYWMYSASANINTSIEDSIKIYASISNFIDKVYESGVNLGDNQLTIRYAQMCLLNDNARNYCIGHFDHLNDLTDWNKLWYPADFKPTDEILKTPNKNISNLVYERGIKILDEAKDLDEAYLEVAKKDRIISHTKDRICKNCTFFDKCDGIKIGEVRQNTNFQDMRKLQVKCNFKLTENDIKKFKFASKLNYTKLFAAN